MKYGDFSDIETTVATKDGMCFECDEPIYAGSTIYTALYGPAAAVVAFHELCWQAGREEESNEAI